MGLFSKKTKEEKELRKEIKARFIGETLQPIGKIPLGVTVGLSLKPEDNVLNIHYDKIDITLPYERIRGFRIEKETTLAGAGSGIGGALIGGALAGGAGAIVGANSKKGKTETKWIGTLAYVDKEGNPQELLFREFMYKGDTPSWNTSEFQKAVNNIVSRDGDDITEL